jgi:hypothetical protein
MNFSKNILTIATLLALLSCDRLQSKGDSIIGKTRETVASTKKKIRAKKQVLVDKVFPIYDCYQADTDNNRKRFKEHLQVDASNDVKSIYTYGDFFGIDYKILVAFIADKATIDSIISIKKMQLTTEKGGGLFFSWDLVWWDKDQIELLRPYKVGLEGEYWEYLWYDPKTNRAFYQEFSL